MITFAKSIFLKAFVEKLSNDNKTTILGIAAGSLLLAQLDWGKLIKGDAGELGKAAGAIVTAVICYYTNKPDKKKGTEDSLNKPEP